MSATVTVRVYRITRAVGSWRPQSVSRVRLHRRAYPDVIAKPDGRHGVELTRMVRVRRRQFLSRMPHIASSTVLFDRTWWPIQLRVHIATAWISEYGYDY